MSSDVLFVSYHTPKYAAAANRLSRSMDRFDLSYEVEELPPIGCWKSNCMQRFEYLLEKFWAHPERAVVWLDSDAVVMHNPSLFQKYFDHRHSIDMSCGFERRSRNPYKVDKSDYHFYRTLELQGGTMYYGPSERREEFMSRVIKHCYSDPSLHIRSQAFLFDILLEYWADPTRRWRFRELPQTYVHVQDPQDRPARARRARQDRAYARRAGELRSRRYPAVRRKNPQVVVHCPNDQEFRDSLEQECQPFWKRPGWVRGTRYTQEEIDNGHCPIV